MKITFLTRSIGISGGLRAVLKLSDLLAKRGHDVEVTVLEGKHVSGKNFNPNKPLWQPTRASIRFVPELKEAHLRPSDVTIATSWVTAEALHPLSAKVGEKAYFIQHYESMYHGPKDRVDPTYTRDFHYISTSDWLKEFLLEKFKKDSELFITPVDLDVFTPRKVARPDTFRICTMYSHLPWKRFALGLETIDLVRESGRQMELVVISAYRTQIHGPLIELHIGKSQEDLAEVFSSCDIYLSTTEVEGLGMPQMEAMACGCALVTTDTRGCHTYAVHEKNALIVEPANARGLADAIIRLHDDRAELKKLQLAGRKKIRTYSWDKAVDKLAAGFERRHRARTVATPNAASRRVGRHRSQ